MTPQTHLQPIEERVEALLKQLTLKEKVFMLSGRDSWATMPVERLGIPALVMTDGPHGVRANQPDAGRAVSGPTTAFPPGVSMASTWNPDLIEKAGVALGEETKAMGCDILLGPCVNIVRTPIAGRNFESYSEDPYLAGRIGTAYVKGVQKAGAGTSLKHYAANNQEIERFRGSSEVDERALREIYLAQFEAIVKDSQPWTVMCSYNRINGEYASQHHHLLTEILKDEWGFEGVVVSDWTANHTTTESVKGGLDLEMPGPAKWYGALLLEAVNIWQIEEADIDKAVRRMLRMALRSGKMDGVVYKGSVNTPAHQNLARQVAEEAITLLKNDRSILPLKPGQMQHVAVIGSAAMDLSISGGGSAYVEPPYRVMPLMALQKTLGEQAEIRYETGADNWLSIPTIKSSMVTPIKGEGKGFYAEYFNGVGFEGEPFATRVDPRLEFWWFSAGPITGITPRFSVRWQGKLEVPASGRYTFEVAHSGQAKLYLDGKLLGENEWNPERHVDIGHFRPVVQLEAGKSYDLRMELINAANSEFTTARISLGATPEVDDRIERAVALAREAEVALVYVGDDDHFETEGNDRPNLKLPAAQNELVARVAEANPNTVVILNVGAPVEMPWADKVAAIVQAYYPGIEGSAAITKVLTGEVNPSGKLTVTYPKRFEDTPSFTNLSIQNAREVHYGEGIFVGYRYYDTAKVDPLFPFGHGLSYTTFQYSNLKIPDAINPGQTCEASVDVTNTGKVAGREVVQLYVHDEKSSVTRPEKELKGFEKLALEPGQTKTVRFALNPRAFSFYDVLSKDWVAEPGKFEILIGSSSRDIRLQAQIELTK